MKSKYKSEKSNENKHKSNVVLKENEKKTLKDMMSVTRPLNICLRISCIRACEYFKSFITK